MTKSATQGWGPPRPPEPAEPPPAREPPDESGQRPSGQPRASDLLLRAAHRRYEFGRAVTGDPFAVAREGPRQARLLRGGRLSLRAELAAQYAATMRRAAPQQALADVLLALEGYALAKPDSELHLRIAGDETGLQLDLGTTDCTVVHVSPTGWRVGVAEDLLFLRTELTGPLPLPERSADGLDELQDLLNVTEDDWPLLLAWLVAAFLPGISHPIGLLSGEQGTGKTTAARMLRSLIDPSVADMQSTPRDERAWAATAAASWVVGIDNLSRVNEWLSDCLCRAVTGDAFVARSLYTNGDVYVRRFRRVLLLTSIDPGALRGDLADRLLPITLERLGDRYRSERELQAMFDAARPRILGALLDLVVKVLAALPAARAAMATRPRMADFAEVLAALDAVLGTKALHDYLGAGEQLAAAVVESDPVAAAVRDLAVHHPSWTGTAAELLELLNQVTRYHTHKTWPADGTRLSGRLRRAATELRKVGVDVDFPPKRQGTRTITITATNGAHPDEEELWPPGSIAGR